MKNWDEYFLNEDHKETRSEKIAFICETVQSLPNVLVTKVYDFLEDLMEQDETTMHENKDTGVEDNEETTEDTEDTEETTEE